MDVITLTKQLVAIPSARSTHGTLGEAEADVAAYIESRCKTLLSPTWSVERQGVIGARENLLVHDGSPVRILLIGHMDVVEIGGAWTTNPLGEEKEGKLYGRGGADMKSGVAAILTSLRFAEEYKIPGVAALFYCDEEYEFLGMKAFVDRYKDQMRPKIVLCPEPTQLNILTGVRGCIELHLEIEGVAGHAARPHMGVNAFRALMEGVAGLDAFCAGITDPILGSPTLNITGVHCGLKEKDGSLVSPANVIPNYCKAIVEVRSVPGITKDDIVRKFEKHIKASGARIGSITAPLNLGTYATEKKDVSALEKAQQDILGEIRYDNPAERGYSDIQMLAECWSVPAALIGARGGNTHGPDEYVDMQSIQSLEKIFFSFLKNTV